MGESCLRLVTTLSWHEQKLDLTQHKLVHDGPLVWRLRSHRLIELQVLLLEDILVLLQRADERLVLKCQSTNQLSIGNDYKYTHSPVLKLQNLLARNVATGLWGMSLRLCLHLSTGWNVCLCVSVGNVCVFVSVGNICVHRECVSIGNVCLCLWGMSVCLCL